jgi:single-strand DNA-binding protein
MLKVEIIGNLGADVEVKDSNGSQFATFRVADTSRYKTQSGEDKEVTNWIDCSYNNVESKVLPYLKAGVKVFVRGNASLRVYSSKKDRCMKAGLQVSVQEIELCGGNNDTVPRQIIDPENGAIFDTAKYYWCNAPTKGMKKEDLKLMVDARGNQYAMNNQGFVAPVPEQTEEETEGSENQAQG